MLLKSENWVGAGAQLGSNIYSRNRFFTIANSDQKLRESRYCSFLFLYNFAFFFTFGYTCCSAW